MALLNWLAGNRFAQKLLERSVTVTQSLMGIGLGTGVQSSSEQAVFNLLRQNCQPPYYIFDVGSNQGQYLNFTLSLIPISSCTVHCFEPRGNNFSKVS